MLPSDLKRFESGDGDDDDDDHLGGGEAYDDETEACAYNYAFFHLIFALATMYVAMLLTDWNSMQGNPKELMRIGQSYTAVWVRVVSAWICVLLYAWTLVAPLLFPNR
ncbi:serine incorporator/TMS membrane protein [Syncephalis pseudoplumigaleata]|uniref:Serine incorporator/TMS membrane protein n=1 Tax=Syncephalis pseudoplumigaleata TaxID=1712513 RepID=A0A4P9YSS9_9FUNG|nr:serine incorporator/TMS membrane protein [Syncephalis pseudoplumigaleata]|eukprot:RKP22824.1 serine incorporator/TMS membrane protein [Syncephalis pseudoplumigaleata]